MIPSARLAAVVDILSEIIEDTRPADQTASFYFRSRRYIGAKDRRAITARLWRVLRHKARLTWWLEEQDMPVTPRSMVLADAAFCREEVEFDGPHGLPSPTAEERRLMTALEGRDVFHHGMPAWVKAEVPEWVLPRLEALWGKDTLAELAAMRSEAPLDVRVNTLKGTRDEARTALKDEGVESAPTALSPLGLRLTERVPLVQYAPWRNGLIEVQDEGSQLVALLTDARPGQAVVDYCAGAGGKTLALAAAMNNSGRLVACDVAEWRMDKAQERLRRAGVCNVTRRVLDSAGNKWIKRNAGEFDRVLVDAPCSGTGTWRRNPDAKWSMRERDVQELVVRQAEVLDSAMRLVKPGGRLIYATCSVLPEENEQQVEAFLSRHSNFTVMKMAPLWKEMIPGVSCPVKGPYLRLSPRQNNTDGFFAAVLSRSED